MRASLLAASALAIVLHSATLSFASNFTLRDDISGDGFFNAFDWFTAPDPTNSFVKYVDVNTAKSNNMAYTDPATGRFVLKPGMERVTLAAVGRQSNRITSKKAMMDGVVIAKISHMPQGCGTWPAFWTTARDSWPAQGEIDILEGVNDISPNTMSLHTGTGCSIGASNDTQPGALNITAINSNVTLMNVDRTLYSGSSGHQDCNFQPGCGVVARNNNTYGPGFNDNGGGYYVMVRDLVATNGTGVSIFFWPNGASNIPAAVSAAASTNGKGSTAPPFVLTEDMFKSWGTPQARFPRDTSSCSMADRFGPHLVIFNTAFCGDWAGGTFLTTPGCPTTQTCEDYVRNNPGAMQNARFELDYLRIYSNSGVVRGAVVAKGALAASLVVMAVAFISSL